MYPNPLPILMVLVATCITLPVAYDLLPFAPRGTRVLAAAMATGSAVLLGWWLSGLAG